jgi:hypothetical protein
MGEVSENRGHLWVTKSAHGPISALPARPNRVEPQVSHVGFREPRTTRHICFELQRAFRKVAPGHKKQRQSGLQPVLVDNHDNPC